MLKKRSGFTVIEILVTTAIVAILSIVAVYAYIDIIEEGKASELIPILGEIRNATLDYYDEHGDWPRKIADLSLNIGGARYVLPFVGSFPTHDDVQDYIFTENFAYGIYVYDKKNFYEPHIYVVRRKPGSHYYNLSFRINELGQLKWYQTSYFWTEQDGISTKFDVMIKARVMFKMMKRLTGNNRPEWENELHENA